MMDITVIMNYRYNGYKGYKGYNGYNRYKGYNGFSVLYPPVQALTCSYTEEVAKATKYICN